ncbi:3-hydroxyacyl-CoA dehydrogenase NAD-binding domain-containing protein [Rhizobium sp. BK251]|uniref:3-hydroxyacyl-CoA dehydrogenase NAD-binding domain-containing protein n=1 Tax=Rhizobium sp. BK251 TaxID=2512125 RepID=UPI0010D7F196|nr:3-hydroxyacyl-CoA dehydrogenase NAD-binding domain-containing protein [Rhizobium sp. BK251]TCL71504.1 3-hydroxyacyl-CoA dehydrogenase [Rhizobium sp. BK251]
MEISSESGVPQEFSSTVRGEMRGSTLVVTIDNPPVNATGADVRAGLMTALDRAKADDVAAIVLTGTGKTFIGGADIKEFGKPPVLPTLPDVIEAIESSPKRIVAAVNGAALGGGLEVALACHARILSPAASLGLPEVTLGLVPGAGGTQRLPRLVGAIGALDMIAGGKPIAAGKAVEIGLAERLAGGDLVAEAACYADELANAPIRRTGTLPVSAFAPSEFEDLAARYVKRARGQTAPQEAIRLVALASKVDLQAGLAEERTTFLRLRDGTQSKALRHIFFAERAAGKPADISSFEPRSLAVVGVAGTGLMGCGIAVATLAAGYSVIALDQSPEAAAKGRERISELIGAAVKSGRLSSEAADEQLGRLVVSAEPNDMKAADLVIEAVFDELDVKIDLFRKLDGIVRSDTVLATNTSYLDPDVIAAATAHPERVIGLHFFSPAHIMRLVEVVRCQQTDPAVLATALAFARKLRKVPVVAGVCEGFIGNRIFSAYRTEAERLIEEGALPQDIDLAMEDYGFAMGLFAVYDMAGLEIAWARRKRQAASRDPNAPYFEIPDRLCQAGRFGRRAGKGWYLYQNGERTVDPEIDRMIADYRIEKGFVARAIGKDEIMSRLLQAMAREGQALIDEGIAGTADDIDVVLVLGYGFPAHQGGPMFAAAHGSDR